jgi:hypothetical protein
MRGKFTAIDDLDMAGHRIRDWRWLNDIPTKGAASGQVLTFDGEDVRWATVSGTGIVVLEWDDIEGKPTTFPPESHTHVTTDITDFKASVHVVFGDGLSAIRDSVGDEDQVDFVVPYDMTITGWTLLADQSGDIDLDVWAATPAGFPPTVADTIVGVNAPTLSSTSINSATGLSWSLTEGDIVRVVVDTSSVASVTRVTLALTGERT